MIRGRAPAVPQVIRLDEVNSTNDEAIRLAESGAPEFTVVTALSQTAGRGRCGREWVSKPGSGLYASMILRPQGMAGITLIPLLSGIATAEALMETASCKAELKWPNDVLISGRKVSGILAETSGTAGSPGFAVVVGAGVNISTDPAALPVRLVYPATSVLAETGSAPFVEDLLSAWIRRMKFLAEELTSGNTAGICARWRELDSMNGRLVSVSQPDGSTAAGIGRGIDEEGALLLEETGGNAVRVLAGDARIC